MQNGKLWEQTMWVRGTKEREFGLLPTPMASDRTDHKAEYNRNAESQSGRTLTLYARKYPNPQFPTPTHAMYKQDVNDNGRYAKWVKEKGHQITLPTAIKLLPTQQESKKTGTLNPMWVEWLMGFPRGWTDLKDSETQ